MPIRSEKRQTYSGPVEVWVNGTKRMDASVRLAGYVDVSVVPTLGIDHPEPVDGVSSWSGFLEGLNEIDAMTLLPEQLELKFPDGRVGEARLHGTSGHLEGSGATPFD
jgi:hypothetical protein